MCDMSARCGTHAGYTRHRRRGEDSCPECRAGEAAYRAERRRIVEKFDADEPAELGLWTGFASELPNGWEFGWCVAEAGRNRAGIPLDRRLVEDSTGHSGQIMSDEVYHDDDYVALRRWFTPEFHFERPAVTVQSVKSAWLSGDPMAPELMRLLSQRGIDAALDALGYGGRFTVTPLGNPRCDEIESMTEPENIPPSPDWPWNVEFRGWRERTVHGPAGAVATDTGDVLVARTYVLRAPAGTSFIDGITPLPDDIAEMMSDLQRAMPYRVKPYSVALYAARFRATTPAVVALRNQPNGVGVSVKMPSRDTHQLGIYPTEDEAVSEAKSWITEEGACLRWAALGAPAPQPLVEWVD